MFGGAGFISNIDMGHALFKATWDFWLTKYSEIVEMLGCASLGTC